MSDQPDKKVLIGKILTIEGLLLLLGGIFLSVKKYFLDFTLVDAEMDTAIGSIIIVLGFVNVFIANKFFGRDAK